MNADPEHAAVIVANTLEPAIYSFGQLDAFVRAFIHQGISNYPVHLKFDTGMHRLGFAIEEKEQVLNAVVSQPELQIKGIYSHLADADNADDTRFTRSQIAAFETVKQYFDAHCPDSGQFLYHLLNSEGSLHFPEAQYNMIRLGIVLYGYPSDPKLAAEMLPSVGWKSAVSQVKTIPAGDFVGYGVSFKAERETTLAIVPVGYADGFRRSLGNGKGAVYIHGERCPVLGRVCMDMIMVDVTGLPVEENDAVEIIGPHQGMPAFAKAMETIPYEVMTGLSKRMHRIYIE
jgi:alanine racemase